MRFPSSGRWQRHESPSDAEPTRRPRRALRDRARFGGAQPIPRFFECYLSARPPYYLATPNIGEWYVLRTLPPPTYICTPHGRHGSKLRTARMMSMPLNLSGPFSSKIGVFWTASSYGPGVPKVSRGLAFQGV